MPQFFLSYRRADSRHVTSRLYDRLTQHYGKASVFKDVDSLPPGVDFRQYLTDTLAKSNYVLVVIGPNWAKSRNDAGMLRLYDVNDYVRIEIEQAFRLGLKVIPLLIDDATMPKAGDLPTSIQKLAFQQASPLRPDPDFHRDVDRLFAGLAPPQPAEKKSAATPIVKLPENNKLVWRIVGAGAALFVVLAIYVALARRGSSTGGPPTAHAEETSNSDAAPAVPAAAAAPQVPPGPTQNPFVELIKTSISPSDWEDGFCRASAFGNLLTIVAPYEKQEEVEALLNTIRRSHGLPRRSCRPSTGDESAEQDYYDLVAELDLKTEVQYLDTPLSDVAVNIELRHKIDIQLDLEALAADGKGSDWPITEDLTNVTLRTALRRILGPENLTYDVQPGYLLITTRAGAPMSTMIHDVSDLAAAGVVP